MVIIIINIIINIKIIIIIIIFTLVLFTIWHIHTLNHSFLVNPLG